LSNTANGSYALKNNTTGNYNVASGFKALFTNDGDNNTAAGVSALYSNTSGLNNIALGYQAGYNLTTGSNNIHIGNQGIAGEAAKIRIGTKGTHKNTFIAGIHGATVASATGTGVFVDANGHLGTVQSSARFKNEIKPMDKASEAILKFEPVTFRYKEELDSESVPQFGLIAEQVEKVNPDLVARDEEGKPYTVRYEAVNAMLLNEFLKEHREVQELESGMQALTARMKKQESQIQKVSAQVGLRKRAPQIVANK
jgi:hypothetical protein